jgi:AcrR family transcriptional regulator
VTPMTRKQRQAHTRERLMESAVRVFSRRGLAHGSIDDVAADAGFTKGAFYANFASKEELFLAMLDERFAQRVAELDGILAGDEDLDVQVRAGAEDFMRYLKADPEWERLFFEFAAHAGRDADFRVELVARYRRLRERIAELCRRRVEQAGIEPPVPVDDIATMLFAMANGIALEQMLEPDALPDGLYASMVEIFTLGLMAKAGELVPPTR